MKSFEDLQKEYTGDGEKSFLTLSIPVDEQIKQYQIGMLEKNRLNLLLPLVVQRVNDDWKLSFDITSKIPLSRVLERKALQHHEFEFIIRQLAALVHDLKEYLLDLSSAVLDKSYIYCDPADFTLFFIYLPVKSTESEPERIKSFLRKLIVEDIRLVEDVSGALLKKLLDALKSETFTSELLYQCINGADLKAQQNTNRTVDGINAGFPGEKEAVDKNTNNPGTQAAVSTNRRPGQEKSPVKGKNDGNRSAGEQPDYFIPRSNRGLPTAKARNEQSNAYKGNLSTSSKQNTGITALLKKYPRNSWLITGGVNVLFFGFLIYIIVSSGKNPNNAVSNIAGFLLIAAACNYFLITKLFSKEKLNPDSASADVPKRNTNTQKRFINRNDDEDIILPKNPAAHFREETNRDRGLPPSAAQSSSLVYGSTIPTGYHEDTVIHPKEERKPDQRIQQSENASDRGIFSDTGSKPETNRENVHAIHLQAERQMAAAQEPKEKNSLTAEDAAVHLSKAVTPQTSESKTTPAGTQEYAEAPAAFLSVNSRNSKNQSFPDKTMVLGRPSLQVPSLVSLSRPYEKILLDKNTLLIGRLSDSVDYVIQNRAVGKIHAEIKKNGDRYFIMDLNSVNGTYVNGERLICNTETPMNNGDKIILANEPYTFTV
jgi:pSer/pThr/pTyr-binding forkhead associated (FHA) protein